MNEQYLIYIGVILVITALVGNLIYNIIGYNNESKAILKIKDYCIDHTPKSCFKYCINALESVDEEDTCLKIYNKYKILNDED